MRYNQFVGISMSGISNFIVTELQSLISAGPSVIGKNRAIEAFAASKSPLFFSECDFVTEQWTELALAIDIHVLSTNYFLILLCQQVRDIFEIFYLLGQVFEVCMLSLKTYTPASDQRAERQNLT